MTFGSALRAARIHSGRTIRELADMLDISDPYLSEVERDIKAPLTDPRVRLAAAYLNADKDLLLALATEGRKYNAVPGSMTDPRRRRFATALLRRLGSMSEEEFRKLESVVRDATA